MQLRFSNVRSGGAMMIPFGDKTRGHGSHTLAALWKH
jgi:hypothetical protein